MNDDLSQIQIILIVLVIVAMFSYGLISHYWVDTRPTVEEKRKWLRRSLTVFGFLNVGAIIGLAFIFHYDLRYSVHFLAMILIIPIIVHMLLQSTFICDACGKRSESRKKWPGTFSCPRCGQRLQ